jgi:prolipoprotein diacylglyceryl transferase
MGLMASIPSPGDNAGHIGPVELRAYGLAIALGVLAAAAIARRRWASRGGDPDDIAAIALWAVPAGLVGARLYHVATDWHRFEGRWWHIPAVWEGGLGIPGGLTAGVLAGLWAARRRGLPAGPLLDVVAPAIPVAQAIGRLGNWFNQELFGRPTDLPWGLEIDPAHRPARYADVATFHPTYAYEALWALALAALLIGIEHRWHPRPGQLFAAYVAGYAGGRLWVEALRVDPATEIAGLRVNLWTSGIALAAGVVVLVARARRPATGDRRRPHVRGSEARMTGTEADATTPDVVFYWRPGCVFCWMLRRTLQRSGLVLDERNIWHDPDAAAFVRSVAGGHETVPTVVVGETALVNPPAAAVIARLGDPGRRAPQKRRGLRGSPARRFWTP